MTGILLALLGMLGVLGMTVVSDMVSEEVRDRLNHLPHAIIRLAANRLTSSQRVTVYEEEWLPELTYILKGAETRPMTRLIIGTRYALGILKTVGQISRRLDRLSTEQATIPGKSVTWVKPHYVRVYVEGETERGFVTASVKGHYRRRSTPGAQAIQPEQQGYYRH